MNFHSDPIAAVTAAIRDFETVSLEEMGAAALMDRIDRKFLVPTALLPEILSRISSAYRLLDVNGQQRFQYKTSYFDTSDLALYHAHHAGRGKRFKVRIRRYNDDDPGYLEVKLKTGRGRTKKDRARRAQALSPMEQLEKERLLDVTDSIAAGRLQEAMQAEFTRITLVRRDAVERVTLDLMLTFSRDGASRAFPEVAVAEVKQAARAPSPFVDAVRALHIREGSLSKYCAGIASLEPRAKKNRFREFLRRLDAIGRNPAVRRT